MRARVTGCRLPDLGTHSWCTPAVHVNACPVCECGVVNDDDVRAERRTRIKKKNKKTENTHTHTRQ